MANHKTRLLTVFALLSQGACTTAMMPAPDAGLGAPCREDAQCRHLNSRERGMLTKIFGKSLPLDEIEIRYNPVGRVSGVLAAAYVTDAAPMTMQVNTADMRSADYTATPESAELFAHEVTHMWQRRQGMDMKGQREALHAQHDEFTTAYKYDLIPGRAFASYNHEQQAEIVGGYAARLVGSADLAGKIKDMGMDTFGQTLKARHCDDIKQYETVLAPVLQGRRDGFCATNLRPAPAKL